MNDKLDLLTESLAAVPTDIQSLKQDVAQLKEDMTIVKHAVSAYSTDLDDHERRVTHLEKRAA